MKKPLRGGFFAAPISTTAKAKESRSQSTMIKINRTHGAGRPNFLQQPTPINQ